MCITQAVEVDVNVLWAWFWFRLRIRLWVSSYSSQTDQDCDQHYLEHLLEIVLQDGVIFSIYIGLAP